jgi:hypothetical protein
MSRQQPQTLPSAPSLRGAANALRSAAKERLTDAIQKIAATTADALDGTQTAIEGLEGRLRRLAEPNVTDPKHRSPLLVSGDRIIGGVSIQGLLQSVKGQSLDMTFTNQTGTIASMDHQTGGYLALVLAGNGVVLSSKAGAPANSAAAGTDGEIRMDNSYIYLHTGGSWRRAALSTF